MEILTKLTLGLVAGTWYLFGRVCRLGEDGLPVGPHKHDEREVEEDQVDNWRNKKGFKVICSLTCAFTSSKLPLAP